jgi:ATP-dependent DNA helicase RecQ
MSNTQSTLQQYFGYNTFRPLQQEIIDDVMNHKNVFVLMPTGGGKSLCYQLPSLLMEGTTVVISPLISLMKDQVDTLRQNGIKAAYLNSSLSFSEQQTVLRQLQMNELSLLYVAPERLALPAFLQTLQQTKINFFAIDEAHCISQWGHDFRPEYRQLKLLRNNFPDKTIIALTATATPRVKTDIINELNITDAKIYQASFIRPNLTYTIIHKQSPFQQIFSYVQAHPGEAGIIYCQSRKKVTSLAERLQREGIKVLPYHAGLPDEERKQNQERFIKEDVDVIIATVAFGMGIDKPNVRYVIHNDLPQSLEHYYQETGRAGRDGLASECLFLFSIADKFTYERFIIEKQSQEEQLVAKEQLRRVIEYAQSQLCRRNLLLHYFAEETPKTKCNACDNCLTPQETFDATELAQKILSCVYRVQERFGIGHVVAILTGSKTMKITKYQHETLSTFGIVTDYTKQELKMFLYELIQQGFLQQSKDQYGLLALTPRSKAVLLGKETVTLIKPPETFIVTTGRKTYSDEATNYDATLFENLRRLRKQIADEKNVPPYIVFSDESLKDMASSYPQTPEQFAQIYGVGEEKNKTYAIPFLAEICKYCKPLGIMPAITPKRQRVRKKSASTATTDTVFITLQSYKQGKTISEIAKERDLKEETIHSHLQKAYSHGEPFDIDTFVSPQKQIIIQKAFEELGLDRLAPIKEKLGDDYSYVEISWVQTMMNVK